MWGAFVLQCDFGLPTKVVLPSWQMTLTIPLVSENYPFDGLLASDKTGTIQVYGDSVDTDGDGIMDILLPDTLSDYPGGLYITLENDLPPITLPEDMFVITGSLRTYKSPFTISFGDPYDGNVPCNSTFSP